MNNGPATTAPVTPPPPAPAPQPTVAPTPPPTPKSAGELKKELNGKEYGEYVLDFLNDHKDFDKHIICVKLEELDLKHLVDFDADNYNYNELYLFDVYARMVVNKVPINDPEQFKLAEDFFLSYAPTDEQKVYWVGWLITCKLPKYLAKEKDDDE